MFRIVAGDESLEHPSCLSKLSESLAHFKVDPSRITTTFNVLMNVSVGAQRRVNVLAPTREVTAVLVNQLSIQLSNALARTFSENQRTLKAVRGSSLLRFETSSGSF